MKKKLENVKNQRVRDSIKANLRNQSYELMIVQFKERGLNPLFKSYLELVTLEKSSEVCLQAFAFFQYYYEITEDVETKIEIGDSIITLLSFAYYNVVLNGYKLAFSYLIDIYEMNPIREDTCNAILFFSSFPDFPSDYFTYDIQKGAYDILKNIKNPKEDYKFSMNDWKSRRWVKEREGRDDVSN